AGEHDSLVATEATGRGTAATSTAPADILAGTSATADEQREPPGCMPWRGQRTHLERAKAQYVAGLDRTHRLDFAVRLSSCSLQQVALDGADQHLELGPTLAQLADVADVVVVVMGQQH